MTQTDSKPTLTRTAVVVLRPDGIVSVTIRPKLRQFLTDAKDNLGAAITLAGALRRPLLVDIRVSEMLDPEARHYYGKSPLAESFTAFALVLNANPLGQMMGNIYLKIARHAVPTQLFIDEPKAILWLTKYR